jgi:hypothetical protein
MTVTLSSIQKAVSDAILRRDGSCLDLIRTPPNDSKQAMFGVYEHAYGARLAEFIANDHEKLKAYMGEAEFRRMSIAYIAKHPSDQPNARWYSRHLPAFLETAMAYRRHPELAELAALERALNDAFDAAEAPSAGLADLAALDPSRFASARLGIHPSTRRLKFNSNVTSLWASLKCGESPPPSFRLDEPQDILVWRQGSSSRFRMLGPEEAMAFDTARDGTPFGVICEMLAMMDDPESAALRAATYLRGWIEAEIVSRILDADDGGEK